MRTTTHAHRSTGYRHTRLAPIATAGAALALVLSYGVMSATPASASSNALSFSTAPVSSTAGANIAVVVQTSDHGGVGDTVALSTSPSTGNKQITGYTAVVGSNGVATFSNFSINTAGTYNITATDSSHPYWYSPVTQSKVTINAGSVHQIAFTKGPQGWSRWDTNLSKFAVSVEDAYGNVVTGNQDVIALSSSCGLGGTYSVAAVNGVATFDAVQIRSGTSCTFTAKDTTTTGLNTVTSSTVYLFGTANQLAFTSPHPPTSATLGVAMPTFKVSVEDQRGVRVVWGTGSNDYVTVTATGAGCVLNTNAVTKQAYEGVVAFKDVAFNAGADCELVANDASRPLTTAVSHNIGLASSVATKLGFTKQPPAKVNAGKMLGSFKVAVQESNGQTLSSGTGSNDTITLSSSCRLAGSTSAVAAKGVATFSHVILATAGACTLVANDASRSLATATSTPIAVSAGSPTHLAFTSSPTITTPSVPFAPFRVSVEDQYNNVVTSGSGSSDSILLTSSCGLVGTTSVTAVAGVATFTNVSATASGSCVLTANDLSRLVVAASATVTVGQSQTSLRITSTTTTLNQPLTLTTGGGSGSGSVTYTVTNGTATGCTINGTTLRANTTGTCVVTATKAASGAFTSSSVTASVLVLPAGPRAHHVVHDVWSGRTVVIRILGSGFHGQPRIISNVPGFIARVTHDTGDSLTVVVTVHGRHHPGTRVMTMIWSNHLRTSVHYTLH